MHSQKTLLPILITSAAFHFIIICKYILLDFVIIQIFNTWETIFLLENYVWILENRKQDRAYPLKSVGLFPKFPFSVSDRNGLKYIMLLQSRHFQKHCWGNIVGDGFNQKY